MIWDIVCGLGIFEVCLECGNLCCDVNVLLCWCGEEKFGICIEMKNVNFMCFVEWVVWYEI